jgi:thioesterase domain-containing protein
LEIHEIEGNHDNILLEPQVQSVARQLTTYLKASQTTRVAELITA